MCLFFIMLAAGPRVAGLFWWLFAADALGYGVQQRAVADRGIDLRTVDDADVGVGGAAGGDQRL